VKKLLSLFVFLGLVIGMAGVVGCGDDKKPAPAAKEKDKDKTPAADKDKKP
jgi:hypothetical protein